MLAFVSVSTCELHHNNVGDREECRLLDSGREQR